VIGVALADTREKWSSGIEEAPARHFLAQVIGRYLSAAHRDRPQDGCPIAGLGSDLFRQDSTIRGAFEDELRHTIAQIAGKLDSVAGDAPDSRATAMLATLVGSLILARGVRDENFSDAILRAGRRFLANSLLREGAKHQ
jgi:TetR/AcrR family transcriptional repressor of nem operon